MDRVRRRVVSFPATVKGVPAAIVEAVRMKETDGDLVNRFGTHRWSNEDLDPVRPERRNWTAWNFFSYWIGESWGASTWSVGSSMVAGGLVWYDAMIAIIVGLLIGSFFLVWIRATFGPWGGLIPVGIRCVLDMVWFGIQTYFGALFLDIVFQCVFGHSWTNLHNSLPESSGTTTRFMVAYFLYWCFQFGSCFFRPDQLRWLITFKACTIPFACLGLFIWSLVRSGGPGSFKALAVTTAEGSNKQALLAWGIVGAINNAINGEFGPLIASEPDITRYSRRPRDQILGQLLAAPWSASFTAIMGIIAASCTGKIWGTAIWNPAGILDAIFAENNDPKTKFAVFLVAVTFMVGQVGTNFIANLIPFGVDLSALAPRYINIVRGQIICCIIGGWCMVPWKVLVSGAVFLSCITGMGIFMGCLVGIMLADYFFIRRGNYFIEDLYTSDPQGRYWYFHGWHWRAYVAYVCGIFMPFPGFLGTLGVKSMAAKLGPAMHLYDIGYLVSTFTAMAVYTLLCKISPPDNVAEARAMPFEAMGKKEVLHGLNGRNSEDVENVVVSEDKKM
ncbi:uncharacterized protein LY89DRAFT_736928 [Mollisia scopiformis]|uniref:Uncharacterized protein n=1 Tax=Mollisia scopiformis TaxID=149040 RepID=A0A194X1S3_MOLSC|nr:uncharacterized protein LY89DRAFT_736928 [Mollisia scopiformis]KUJ13929.1 hypothetical protein LY89DRAFT_736928 [Mollisia scopiformis]